MKTTLFVFSATGNTLTTARRIAAQLENCEIISVADVFRNERVETDADAVGFVFPVYHGDPPWPVRELARNLHYTADSPYIFAVTTARGHVGNAPLRLNQTLRVRRKVLSLAVNVQMPGNSLMNTPEEEAAMLAAQDENIKKALGAVINREIRDYSTDQIIPATPVVVPNNFRGITADETCTGCGTCVRVCPMGNIRIEDGKAMIGDDCTTCLACFHWCPTESIWMSKQEGIARRRKYHHPDVKLEDFLVR